MSIFADQKLFMKITGQRASEEMVTLYRDLIAEEFEELDEAYGKNDNVEMADACIDIIYVTIGMLHAMGLDPKPLWDEVQRSNMSKFLIEPCVFCGTKGCDHCNGEGEFYKVMRREDGKILKGPKYSPPDLKSIVERQLGE
ncbi:NTP pyrophosphohydrolase, DR2231-like [uncultured Caudovirales phage]|uniref:NTP pyrophosphohydrolase, DR2231-like n=1 Tax=uncultured Caudovirales phage TaxID=2100421 RepID=A0A6J7WQB3_9CAUD|nr:NTP pyrophosphohydrolase, DR2231-like [uncultured Caudovirales phage]